MRRTVFTSQRALDSVSAGLDDPIWTYSRHSPVVGYLTSQPAGPSDVDLGTADVPLT